MLKSPAGSSTISPPDCGCTIFRSTATGTGWPRSVRPQPAIAAAARSNVRHRLMSGSPQGSPRVATRGLGGSVSRPFVVGRVAQGFLRLRPDLLSDRRHLGVHRHQDTGPLPKRLHHPAALARKLVLVVADLHQRL